MNHKALLFSGLVFLVAPGPVLAELVQSTTSTYLSFRDCEAGETACDTLSRMHARAIGGSPGGQDSPVSLSGPEFGNARANAQLTRQPGAGELTVQITSLAGKRNASSGFTLQRYTNTSDVAETLSFEAVFTYGQTVPEVNSQFPEKGGARTGASVEMQLASIEPESLEAGNTAEENWGIMEGEPPPGLQSLGFARSNDESFNVTGQSEETLQVTAVLEPGQSIWVLAKLQAAAANGAEVSADLVTRLAIDRE